jgi:hypothetical protein
MRWLFALLIAAFVTAASASAFAQAKGKAGAAATATAGDENVDVGGVKYKKKTVYDFDDDVVEGDLMRPDGEFVALKRQAKHSSLIKIREHFIPEMLKSAEDI